MPSRFLRNAVADVISTLPRGRKPLFAEAFPNGTWAALTEVHSLRTRAEHISGIDSPRRYSDQQDGSGLTFAPESERRAWSPPRVGGRLNI